MTSVAPLVLDPDETVNASQVVFLATTAPAPQGGGSSALRPMYFTGRLVVGDRTYVRLNLALSSRSRGAPLVGKGGQVRAVGTLSAHDAGSDTGRSGYAIPARQVSEVASRLVATMRTQNGSPTAPGDSAAAGRDRTPMPANPVAASAPTDLPTEEPTTVPPAAPTDLPATPLPRPSNTAVPPAQPTPEPPPPPVAAQGQPTARPANSVQAPAGAGPTNTIQRHYALINARRYDEGYQLMSTNLRALNSPATYRSWFANKVGITVISTNLVESQDQRAVVDAVVDSTDRVGDTNVTSRVAERFLLVLEDGGWHIATVTRLS